MNNIGGASSDRWGQSALPGSNKVTASLYCTTLFHIKDFIVLMNLFQLTCISHNMVFSRNQNQHYVGNRCSICYAYPEIQILKGLFKQQLTGPFAGPKPKRCCIKMPDMIIMGSRTPRHLAWFATTTPARARCRHLVLNSV